jgi:prepilin-type N-terminal cleavage/methylation domain-containing protein
MLKSKTKFARQARKRGSAFNPQLHPERARSRPARDSSEFIGVRGSTLSQLRAFTLIEMLVVIAILGIMAGLTVPVLKNFAKSDATLGASRQLLDGVARARQLAISQRTTVYMVFVPTNFWNDASGAFNNTWWNTLTLAQQTAATNLCDKQLTGYTFVSLRSVGDQPGQGRPHYLAPWQTLPDGTFIAYQKFTEASNNWYTITDPIDASKFYNVYGFCTNNAIPFPTETAASGPSLPYIAFNYLGQLVSGADPAGEYIPIAKGSVLAARDTMTKRFQFSPPDASEMPPGNSSNSYNIVHIDRLTGRAVLEFQKVK